MVDNPGNPMSGKKRGTSDLNGSANGAAQRRAKIRKIRMQNFLPYEDCSFEPGPALNLVVGPNGSGKSSTVAAIALGLSDKKGREAMKRGEGFKEYIRKDQDWCEIEIQLEDPLGQRRTIVRKIWRHRPHGQESEWTLDGRTAKGSDIDKLAKSLNINIANSCHFLPQEMVQEFSKQAGNPQVLLKLFIEASGGEEMNKLHQDLIKHSKDFKNSLNNVGTYKAEKEALEVRERELESEKERNEHAMELVREIDVRKAKRPYIMRLKMKELAKAKEKEFKENEKPYQESVGSERASKEKMEGMEEQVKAADAQGRRMGQEAKDMQEELKKLFKAMENQDDQCANIDSEESDLKKKLKGLNIDVKEHRKSISEQKVSAKKSAAVDPEIDQKIKDAKARKVERQKRASEANKRHEDANAELSSEQSTLRTVEASLADARDAKQHRLRNLKKIDGHLYKQWEAIHQMMENNQFRQTVYGPLCVEVEVNGNDENLAVYVDSFLGLDGKNFLVQNQHDADIIQKSRDWLVSGITFFNISGKSAGRSNPPVLDRQVLDKYQIKGFLRDFVTGPEPVMEFLRSGQGLDNISIGTEQTFQRCQEMAEDPLLIRKDDFNKKRSKLPVCFTPNRTFRIQYSFYGKQEPRINDDEYRFKNRCKVVLSRPQREIEELQSKVEQSKAKLQQLTESLERLSESAQQCKTEVEEEVIALEKLLDQKNGSRNAAIRIERLETKIADCEKSIKRITDIEIPRNRDKKKSLLDQRIQLVKNVDETMRKMLDALLRCAAADLQQQPLQNEYEELQATHRRNLDVRRALEHALQQAHKEYQDAKEKYQQAKADVDANPASEEAKTQFPDLTADVAELDAEVDRMEAELRDLGHFSDVTKAPPLSETRLSARS